nr:proline-rich receptor-like protein kinase PERK10 [Aegilops tauschii subsp. strangulata]
MPAKTVASKQDWFKAQSSGDSAHPRPGPNRAARRHRPPLRLLPHSARPLDTSWIRGSTPRHPKPRRRTVAAHHHLVGVASPPRPDVAPHLALRPADALAPCSSPAPPGDPAAVVEPPAGDDLPPSRPCHDLLLTGPHHRPSPRPPRVLLADDASSSSSPKAPLSLAAPAHQRRKGRLHHDDLKQRNEDVNAPIPGPAPTAPPDATARLSDSSRTAPAPSIRAGSGARPRGTPSPDAAPSPLTTTSSASPPRLAPTSPRASPCALLTPWLRARVPRRPATLLRWMSHPPATTSLPRARATASSSPDPHHHPSPRPPHLLLADDASSSSSPKAPPSLAAPCSPTQVRTPVLLLLPVPSRRRSPTPPHHPLAAGSRRTARRARRRFPHSPPSLRGLAPLLPLHCSRCQLLLRPASLAVAGQASAQSG